FRSLVESSGGEPGDRSRLSHRPEAQCARAQIRLPGDDRGEDRPVDRIETPGAGGIRGEEVLDRRELPDTLGCPGRALIVELILVRLTILGVSFGLLAFESREMAANFIGRKHTSHFGDKRGSSLAKAGCSVAALAKFI